MVVTVEVVVVSGMIIIHTTQHNFGSNVSIEKEQEREREREKDKEVYIPPYGPPYLPLKLLVIQ